MKVTAPRQCVAPGTSVPPGEVMVATQIGDPALGPLPCPAAPLVAGSLARRGVTARCQAIPRCAETGQAGPGTVLFVTSCLHPDGTATGIGAAAAAQDGRAVVAARAVVEEWSAVIAPRRLTGTGAVWCEGAAGALKQARRAVAGSAAPVYIYEWLAAGAVDRRELEAAGAVFVTSLNEVPAGATLVLPGHGVPPSVRAGALERRLALVDATCPLVAAVQSQIRQFTGDGDRVAVVGPADHAVSGSLTGQAPGRTIGVESIAAASTTAAGDPRRVSYVLQPGIPVEAAAPITGALRSRFPGLHEPDPATFCYAASDRAETVRSIASTADVVLVLGQAEHPDTRLVTGMIRDGHAKAQVVCAAEQVTASWLAGSTAIGVVQTATAPAGLAGILTRALAGLGPLSVTERHVWTRVERPGQPPHEPSHGHNETSTLASPFHRETG
jgi:4-hydroxy-3-methylbut-2-enyl diphosphate reductase